MGKYLQCEAPKIAKLVNITPITMVYRTQITIVTGANLNQLSYRTGASHCITISLSGSPRCAGNWGDEYRAHCDGRCGGSALDRHGERVASWRVEPLRGAAGRGRAEGQGEYWGKTIIKKSKVVPQWAKSLSWCVEKSPISLWFIGELSN